jgi:hypothetical protein
MLRGRRMVKAVVRAQPPEPDSRLPAAAYPVIHNGSCGVILSDVDSRFNSIDLFAGPSLPHATGAKAAKDNSVVATFAAFA